MQLTLIENPDDAIRIEYKIARVVNAETGASSLSVVEALTSMIANYARTSMRAFSDIMDDAEIFDVLNHDSPRHELLMTNPNNRGFQMCLRVATRMMRGNLPDCCCGATRFHHADHMPAWAVARGYIADIDGLLFYL